MSTIKAIFYSKFDTQEGPKVIHQVPECAIVPDDAHPSTDDTISTPFFSFPAISSFLIPRQSLCGNLISISPPPLHRHGPSYLILGYPICLTSPHYARNEFIFNFTLVLSAPTLSSPTTAPDVNAYKSALTKLAQLMLSLEEQSYYLSSDSSRPGTGPLYSLCEMLMEDLNNYSECMIPLNDLNTLNIKLFPTYPPPPVLKPHHVPLLTVHLPSLMDENWDLTMQRIAPHLNGVHSTARVAALADADPSLTRKCIRHLLYYNCLLLLDIFSFSAIYAPTASFGRTIASDPAMQRECAEYVNTAFAPHGATAASSSNGPGSANGLSSDNGIATTSPSIWPLTARGTPLDGAAIVALFASLRQGRSVRAWYAAHAHALANVDLRRFVTFGVIKGFLYRVHKYVYATGERVRGRGRGDEESEEGDGDGEGQARLRRYLDGQHCFDQICTEMGWSERVLEGRLRRWPGEKLEIHR